LPIRIPRGEFDIRDSAIDLMVRVEIAVVRQMLAPGSVVPLSRLAEMFTANEAAIRSALVPLHAGGLVELSDERVRIPDLVYSDIDSLLAERADIEVRITREVVSRLTEEHREQLRGLIRYAHMAAVVGDLEIMVKHDTAIDNIIASLCPDKAAVLRSRVVKSLIRRIWADSQPFLDLVPMMNLRRKAVEALIAGDTELAVRCAVEVIDAVRSLLAPR
jgi:DNA-binding GntR family transcriptional regulator